MTMKKVQDFTAPLIDGLIDIAKQENKYGKKFCSDRFHKIVGLMENINVEGNVELRKVWIEVPRGKIEDFGDYNEFLEEGIVDDPDGFVEEWKGYYPDGSKWYEFSMSSTDDGIFLFIDSDIIFEIGDPSPQGAGECRSSELIEWLEWKIEATIENLRFDTSGYNEYVEMNLPYKKRYGRILRNDHWDIFPEDMEKFREGLSKNDLIILEGIASSSKDDHPDISLDKMTAGEFYRICGIGYLANDYKWIKKEGQSPKEMYYAMADGRDCGLKSVDLDSEDAFRHWYHHDAHCGGHPWEICRGGNSTHISLYVMDMGPGWLLTLDGSSYGRVLETVRIAIALFNNDIPFRLNRADEIIRMVTGSDYIGIVPDGIFSRYCHSYFPKEDRIIDFMHLGFEETDKIIERSYWYPLKEITHRKKLFKTQFISLELGMKSKKKKRRVMK